MEGHNATFPRPETCRYPRSGLYSDKTNPDNSRTRTTRRRRRNPGSLPSSGSSGYDSVSPTSCGSRKVAGNVQEVLACSRCNQFLEDVHVLPCSLALCSACLEQSQTQVVTMPCPACRETHTVPPSTMATATPTPTDRLHTEDFVVDSTHYNTENNSSVIANRHESGGNRQSVLQVDSHTQSPTRREPCDLSPKPRASDMRAQLTDTDNRVGPIQPDTPRLATRLDTSGHNDSGGIALDTIEDTDDDELSVSGRSQAFVGKPLGYNRPPRARPGLRPKYHSSLTCLAEDCDDSTGTRPLSWGCASSEDLTHLSANGEYHSSGLSSAHSLDLPGTSDEMYGTRRAASPPNLHRTSTLPDVHTKSSIRRTQSLRNREPASMGHQDFNSRNTYSSFRYPRTSESKFTISESTKQLERDLNNGNVSLKPSRVSQFVRRGSSRYKRQGSGSPSPADANGTSSSESLPSSFRGYARSSSPAHPATPDPVLRFPTQKGSPRNDCTVGGNSPGVALRADYKSHMTSDSDSVNVDEIVTCKDYTEPSKPAVEPQTPPKPTYPWSSKYKPSETPAPDTPAHTNPAHTTPAYSATAHSTPGLSTPASSTPAHSTPASSPPAHSTPVHGTRSPAFPSSHEAGEVFSSRSHLMESPIFTNVSSHRVYNRASSPLEPMDTSSHLPRQPQSPLPRQPQSPLPRQPQSPPPCRPQRPESNNWKLEESELYSKYLEESDSDDDNEDEVEHSAATRPPVRAFMPQNSSEAETPDDTGGSTASRPSATSPERDARLHTTTGSEGEPLYCQEEIEVDAQVLIEDVFSDSTDSTPKTNDDDCKSPSWKSSRRRSSVAKRTTRKLSSGSCSRRLSSVAKDAEKGEDEVDEEDEGDEDPVEPVYGNPEPQWAVGSCEHEEPTSMAILPNGKVIVANYSHGQLQFYDDSGDFEFNIEGVKPFSVIASSDGHVLFGDRKKKTVLVYDEFGCDVSAWDDNVLDWVSGIGSLSDGNIVVYDRQHCRVKVFTKQGGLLSEFGSYGQRDQQLALADFLAVDSQDRIVIADSGNHCIKVFNRTGKLLLKFGSRGRRRGQLQWPKGVCVDRNDNIIVADMRNYRVCLFSPEGRFIQYVVRKLQYMPFSVCFSPPSSLGVTHFTLDGQSDLILYQMESTSDQSNHAVDSSLPMFRETIV